jgi:folate-dependent phosphoribosylglycinamide formyltransferase PurN
MLTRPLRIAVLTTTRAPGLDHLLERDPNRGRLYEIAAVVATDPASEALARAGAGRVPVVLHDLRAFCASRGGPIRDPALRREFDTETVRLLDAHRPDLVVLCAYLHVLTGPMLERFPDRIINIHDADLSIAGEDGLPRYRGLRSTRDAVMAGEPETRCTVHLVTRDVDVGPVLLRSEPFAVHPLVADARRWGATDILKAYAFAQREWMMRAAWGPLLSRTIEWFARDQVRTLRGRIVIAGVFRPDGIPVASRRRFRPPRRAAGP